MEPLEYVRVLRRRWRLLVACILVAGVTAWITTPANPSNDSVSYRATHQLIRDSSAIAPPAIAQLALFVKTGEVPRRVADRIDHDGEPALLGARVTLEPDEQTGTLGISVTGATPSQAAERANAFAEETLAYLGEEAQAAQREQLERLNEQITTLRVEIDDLDQRIGGDGGDGTAGVLEAERDSKIRQYGAALDQQQQLLNQPPPSAGYVTLQQALPELAEPVGGGFSAPTSRPARTAIAIVLGVVLGLAAVLIAERLDTRLNTREAVQGAFGLPVIAEVPRSSMPEHTIVAATDPLSPAAEAYRTLRSSLVLVPTARGGEGGAGPQVVLVTSPAPGDGKTTTVANLATVFAEAGRSVLVLGCDFRRAEIHRYFGADPRPGISDVLMDSRRKLVSVVRPTPTPGVSVAPSGSALRSFGDVANAGRALVEDARTLADVVIIDTAPLLATNDATELIPAVDAVVVVARAGRTSGDSAKRTRTLLERLGAPAAGVVLNAAVAGESSYYASYYTTQGPRPATPRRRFRRRIKADEITDRIEPWHGPEAPLRPPVRERRSAEGDVSSWPARPAGQEATSPLTDRPELSDPGRGAAPVTHDRPVAHEAPSSSNLRSYGFSPGDDDGPGPVGHPASGTVSDARDH